MNKAVIYARVSSTGERQSTERQVADLKRYAAASDIEVVRVYEEKASGAKIDREQLADCVEFLKGGGADLLLVSELSRLGRSLRQVLDIIDDLTKAGVNIYFQDHNMSTLLPDGKPNEVTTLLVSLMGTFAQIEREQIAYRLNSGRKRAIENGVKMGRPEGSVMTAEQLIAKYPEVVRRIKKGMSVRDIAAVCHVSPQTVQKVRTALATH